MYSILSNCSFEYRDSFFVDCEELMPLYVIIAPTAFLVVIFKPRWHELKTTLLEMKSQIFGYLIWLGCTFPVDMSYFFFWWICSNNHPNFQNQFQSKVDQF